MVDLQPFGASIRAADIHDPNGNRSTPLASIPLNPIRYRELFKLLNLESQRCGRTLTSWHRPWFSFHYPQWTVCCCLFAVQAR